MCYRTAGAAIYRPCPNCGTPQCSDSRYCSVCGAELPPPDEPYEIVTPEEYAAGAARRDVPPADLAAAPHRASGPHDDEESPA